MRRAQAVYSALHIHTKGTRCDWGQWEVNLDWVLSLHLLPYSKAWSLRIRLFTYRGSDT